jgi:TnpA family transposase
MRAINKQLTILSETERDALYELPDFDEAQRVHFLQFTESEQDLIYARKSLADKIYCALQIGYFKAKQTFFEFSWDDLPGKDLLFILEHYFPEVSWHPELISKHEYYLQRKIILQYFGYQNWDKNIHTPQILIHLGVAVCKDATLEFILLEAIAWFRSHKILRPGYTTMQSIISKTLTLERSRLSKLINLQVEDNTQSTLNMLLATDTALSELSALKQDAKDFKYRMMQIECNKLKSLEPIYKLAARILPTLSISQQNISYYASLAHFYTVHELRELNLGQRNLYLLCYAWQRYQKITDNLAEAFCYQIRRFDDSLKITLSSQKLKTYKQQKKQAKKIARLLGLFIDDSYEDITPYGKVRKKAFRILSKEAIKAMTVKFSELTASEQELRWKLYDSFNNKFRRYLRPLFLQLEFMSETYNNQWLQAIQTIKQSFVNQQQFSMKDKQLEKLIPKRLLPYLLSHEEDKESIINAERYEYWFYRQCRERLLDGSLYLNNSIRHSSFESSLLTPEAELEALKTLNIGKFNQPLDKILNSLEQELTELWVDFNRRLKKGEFTHLEYDKAKNHLSLKKIHNEEDTRGAQEQFYRLLSSSNIINVLQFVNEQCDFLKAFTPLQSRYAKKILDANEVFAGIMSQAMNHGLNTMADISNIPYYVLQHNYKQFFREGTLKKVNDIIINAIAKLPIFPYYELGFDLRYGAVDGQKFSTERPTIKSRYSKKHFGRGKGVVAYTLLCNHIPLHSQIINGHDHESHYTFDAVYNNTSTIIPQAISGDMHSVNKINFLLHYWFGFIFSPRFTNVDAEIKKVNCTKEICNYDNYLIKPSAQYNRQLIEEEWSNIRRILVTLAQKEITQEVLIKKLCTYSASNRTRQALFEFDKLIRSIYTLKYIIDPQLQSQVHRSQNRIEAYHQLHSAIAQIGGKKELIGKTDIEIEISNQCGRLIANAIIYYNSAILSKMLEFYRETNNERALAELYKYSPVAWQHIHLIGRYLFDNQQSGIDLTVVLADLLTKNAA